MAEDYVSSLPRPESKKDEHKRLQDDVLNFIIDGGKIDVYNNNGVHIDSHIEVNYDYL
jgi:hypothetical protein